MDNSRALAVKSPQYLQLSNPAGTESEYVREGWCWGGFSFGAFWLMRHRVWRSIIWSLIALIVGGFAMLSAFRYFGGADILKISAAVSLCAIAIFHFFLGKKANIWRQSTLVDRGWVPVRKIFAKNIDEAVEVGESTLADLPPQRVPTLTSESENNQPELKPLSSAGEPEIRTVRVPTQKTTVDMTEDTLNGDRDESDAPTDAPTPDPVSPSLTDEIKDDPNEQTISRKDAREPAARRLPNEDKQFNEPGPRTSCDPAPVDEAVTVTPAANINPKAEPTSTERKPQLKEDTTADDKTAPATTSSSSDHDKTRSAESMFEQALGDKPRGATLRTEPTRVAETRDPPVADGNRPSEEYSVRSNRRGTPTNVDQRAPRDEGATHDAATDDHDGTADATTRPTDHEVERIRVEPTLRPSAKTRKIAESKVKDAERRRRIEQENNELFEFAWNEIEQGEMVPALEARALTQHPNNPDQRKALYIRMRVAQLKEEKLLAREEIAARRRRQVDRAAELEREEVYRDFIEIIKPDTGALEKAKQTLVDFAGSKEADSKASLTVLNSVVDDLGLTVVFAPMAGYVAESTEGRMLELGNRAQLNEFLLALSNCDADSESPTPS